MEEGMPDTNDPREDLHAAQQWAEEEAFFAEVHRITRAVHQDDAAEPEQGDDHAASDVPSFDAYHTVLKRHSAHRVRLEMPILDLAMLLSALQLSLRHPHFPPTVRPYVEDFVTEAIAYLKRIDPVLAQMFRAGNDPSHDVPF